MKIQAESLLYLDRFSDIRYINYVGFLREELDRYFGGEKVVFRMPIDWSDYSSFQRQVLQYAGSIPYGQRVAYGDVARAIGNAKAARAVGQALHINRTPIIVPCHRVLAGDGKLGGFGGGIEYKQKLLDIEGIPYRSVRVATECQAVSLGRV
jgi:O-6-methylguanine DNA methyltransferase